MIGHYYQMPAFAWLANWVSEAFMEGPSHSAWMCYTKAQSQLWTPWSTMALNAFLSSRFWGHVKTWHKKRERVYLWQMCISQKDEIQPPSRGCTERRHSLSRACLNASLLQRQLCSSQRVQLKVHEHLGSSHFGCSCCAWAKPGGKAKGKLSLLPQPSKDTQTHLISSQVTIPGLAGAEVNSKAAVAVQCWSRVSWHRAGCLLLAAAMCEKTSFPPLVFVVVAQI